MLSKLMAVVTVVVIVILSAFILPSILDGVEDAGSNVSDNKTHSKGLVQVISALTLVAIFIVVGVVILGVVRL